MENILIMLILMLLIGSAIAYIVKEKKKGAGCIGCPSSASCHRKTCGENK